jgi:sulfotransferase
MKRSLVFLTGLPRSGSTLLCNILGMHAQIHATPTSPLSSLVESMRQSWSQDAALLAQLDTDFEQVYRRLGRATRAFMEAWSSDTEQPFTVDKSRYWLFIVETLRELYPDFKMIVCLRDLRDIYKSIELQHRKTLLLTFPGQLEQNLVEARATQLFAHTGTVGGPLRALANLNDVPDLRANLFFWRFESFIKDPSGYTEELLRWLGAQPETLSLERITQRTHESDSHYHFKFPHRVSPQLSAPGSFMDADLSTRILNDIVSRNAWFYRQFYRADGVVRLERDGAAPAASGTAGKAP